MITKIVWAAFAQPMAWLWGRDYEFGANSSTEITFKHTEIKIWMGKMFIWTFTMLILQYWYHINTREYMNMIII